MHICAGGYGTINSAVQHPPPVFHLGQLGSYISMAIVDRCVGGVTSGTLEGVDEWVVGACIGQ